MAEGQATPQVRSRRKVRQGVVASAKMSKTVVVSIVRRVQHPLYGKTVLKTERFKAHVDEQMVDGKPVKMIGDQVLEVGDSVEIMETRPISKQKNWRVTRILEKVK